MQRAFGLSIPQTLDDACDPARLALVVYDMQVGIVNQIENAQQIIDSSSGSRCSQKSGDSGLLHAPVLIYLLLPTDMDYWLQPAIDRLKNEHDQTAQKSLLLLLWYAQTDAADQAMTAFAGDASKLSASRTYARELVHRKDKIGSKERTQASDSTEASLRQKRRERLKAVSDEALIDLDDYTMMLIAKRK